MRRTAVQLTVYDWEYMSRLPTLKEPRESVVPRSIVAVSIRLIPKSSPRKEGRCLSPGSSGGLLLIRTVMPPESPATPPTPAMSIG